MRSLKPESDQIVLPMESGHGSGSSRHLRSHPEAIIDEVCLLSPGIKSGSSSSFSSSDSSLDDLFQVDAVELSKSTADTSGSTILDEDAQLATKYGEKDVTSNSSPKSEQTDDGSSGPTSPEVCGFTPALSLHSGLATKSAMQSPPIQVMGRSGDYDSYRIPASVFASKSSTPMEWSVASNESLFSIHVGNNSFSRDQVFLFGRSGELGKPGELTKSGELISLSSRPSLETATSEADKGSADMGEGLGVTEAAAETMKEVLRATVEDRSKEKTTPEEGVRHSSSVSHHSDGSGTSIQSFAFQIKKKCAWPLCCCSNGSRVLCYCTRPNCCCSNSSWAFCYCSKCCRKKCAWPSCCCSNGSWKFCYCSKCCRKKCAWPSCCCSNGSWKFCYCSKCCRKKKCAWPFCCRSSGSRAFCHCTWLNCCSSNSSWTFCYCCNCSRCLPWEEGRSGSVKVDPEKQQSQPQTSGVTRNAAGTKWFRCFSFRCFSFRALQPLCC